MTQPQDPLLPQDWPGWGPLCRIHHEDIEALKAQMGLTMGSLMERLKDVQDIQAIVSNGLQADVREIKDLIHDIKKGFRFTVLVARIAAVSIPAVGTIYALVKFVGIP